MTAFWWTIFLQKTAVWMLWIFGDYKNVSGDIPEEIGFDSVFLISANSGRYYNFNGLDRVMEKGDPENEWYYELLGNDLEYSLNVDNDQVEGADNRITVFVNCKVTAPDGAVIGIL